MEGTNCICLGGGGASPAVLLKRFLRPKGMDGDAARQADRADRADRADSQTVRNLTDADRFILACY